MKLCFRLLLLAISCSITVSSHASGVTISKSSLDSLLFDSVTKSGDLGFVVCILQDGEIVYQGEHGIGNQKTGARLHQQTQFQFGSITKTFTACAVLLLAEEGKIALTDNVRTYIPELPNYAQDITIQHLLGHTSGLRDHSTYLDWQYKTDDSVMTAATTLKVLQDITDLNFEPGTDFAYSNTGYILLRLIIERTSGKSYKGFIEQRILQPLGMHDSYIRPLKEAGPVADGTTAYDHKGKGKFKANKDRYPDAWGAVGLVSTVQDFVKWDRNFEQNVLGNTGPELIELMRRSYRLNDGRLTHYGKGLILKNYHGYDTEEHSGGWEGFNAQHRRIPELNLSIIVAANNNLRHPYVVCNQICDFLLPTKPIAIPETDSGTTSLHTQVVGTYISGNNLVRKVKERNGNLTLDIYYSSDDFDTYTLHGPVEQHTTSLVFIDSLGNELTFQLQEGNAINFSYVGGQYFELKRTFYRIGPTTQDYRGKYELKAAGRKVRLKGAADGSRLALVPIPLVRIKLIRIAGNCYYLKGEKIVLRMNEEGCFVGDQRLYNIVLNKVQ